MEPVAEGNDRFIETAAELTEDVEVVGVSEKRLMFRLTGIGARGLC